MDRVAIALAAPVPFEDNLSSKMSAGAKARSIVLEGLGGRRILAEAAGNNRYVLVADDIVFVGSVGISSGSWFGKKVKSYPIDAITAVDVRQAAITVELEIVMGGSVEVGNIRATFLSRARDENITFFPRQAFPHVQWMASIILQVREYRRNQMRPDPQLPYGQQLQRQTQSGGTYGSSASVTIVEQLKQLAELRDQNLITSDEFETKKRELLGRM